MVGILLKLTNLGAVLAVERVMKFKKDVENLSEKLEILKSLHADAESQRPISRSTNDWLKKLDAAIMDADDVLDELQYQVLRREIQQRDVEEMKRGEFLSERENSCRRACVVEADANYVPFPESDMLELDSARLITFLRRVESTILDLGDEVHKVYTRIWSSGNPGLRLLWYIMHLCVNIWYLALGFINALESFLISSGFFEQYKDLDISKVKYLAVVIDSEEAFNTLKVLELLRWLAAIGLKKVCLYDPEGVLKKSKEALILWLKSERMPKETTKDPLLEQKYLSLEVISFTDGKHAVAKAANVLLKKHYLSANSEKPELTESDMADALGAIGYGAPEPDLMLIYGPTRCHLGFPAWRMRYTEIVHMGSLKSMKFGALLKAIHRYTKVHQNYGS